MAMIDDSLIKEYQLEKDGLAKADLSTKRITIAQRNDGNTLLRIEHNYTCVRFVLTPEQCRHLAGLLNKAADRD